MDKKSIENISNFISLLDGKKEISKFITELFTDKEINDFSLRIELMKQLKAGNTQREIASNFHISLCKVTRGNRYIKDKNSIMNRLLKRDNYE